MIARLKGTVAAIGTETAILDVNGVGYEVNAIPRLLGALNAGEAATLAIETIVREDFIRLYGFGSESDRQCFRILTGVQGVGARHALAILQVLPPAQLYDAVAAEDVTAISRAHGIGKKIAQRIATELQSKLGALAGGVGAGFAPAPNVAANASPDGNIDAPTSGDASSRADAVSALVNLGYDRTDAHRAVASAAQADNAPGVEALITGALKELSPA